MYQTHKYKNSNNNYSLPLSRVSHHRTWYQGKMWVRPAPSPSRLWYFLRSFVFPFFFLLFYFCRWRYFLLRIRFYLFYFLFCDLFCFRFFNWFSLIFRDFTFWIFFFQSWCLIWYILRLLVDFFFFWFDFDWLNYFWILCCWSLFFSIFS